MSYQDGPVIIPLQAVPESCRNSGIMGPGILQCWVSGKIFDDGKIKNKSYPFENQPSSIPPFQYSLFEASVKASKKCPIF
jgi:hypothetical protein